MTPDQFKAWRKRVGFRSQQAVAEALGISKGSVENYEAGRRRDTGEPVAIPEAVIFACAAISLAIQAGVDPRNTRYLRKWAEDQLAVMREPG